MPREFFRNDYDTPDHVGPQVTLGWDKAPNIQLGVVHNPPDVRNYLDDTLAGKTSLTLEQRAEVVEALTEYSAGALGWHCQLGRSEVNRLIRTLRRARDAAFGADA